MSSLLRNLVDTQNTTVYLIGVGLTNEDIELFKVICSSYKVLFEHFEFEDLSRDLSFLDSGRHVKTVYSKFLLENVEGVDYALYLDSDTVILGDIENVWKWNLNGYLFGAVKTISRNHLKTLGMRSDSDFYNDGVVLLNVKEARELGVLNRITAEISYYKGSPPVLSEGLINKLYADAVLNLPLSYNLMSSHIYLAKENRNFLAKDLRMHEEEISNALENPIVIHYITSFYGRPWFTNCTHPFKKEYLNYRAESPFRTEPMLSNKIGLKMKLGKFFNNLFGYVNALKISRVKARIFHVK
jgi:lipopolysaccharide biosynthesis glycosyltransferase